MVPSSGRHGGRAGAASCLCLRLRRGLHRARARGRWRTGLLLRRPAGARASTTRAPATRRATRSRAPARRRGSHPCARCARAGCGAGRCSGRWRSAASPRRRPGCGRGSAVVRARCRRSALLAPIGLGARWRRQLCWPLPATAARSGAAAAATPNGWKWRAFACTGSDLEAARAHWDLGSALLAADAPTGPGDGVGLCLAPQPCPAVGTPASCGAAPFEGLGDFLRDAHLVRGAPRRFRGRWRSGCGRARWQPRPAVAQGRRRGWRRLRSCGSRAGRGTASSGFGPRNSAGRHPVRAGGWRALDRSRGSAVLLPNTGANGARSAMAGVAVRLARRLAAAGIASLRMDGTDIGDGGTAGRRRRRRPAGHLPPATRAGRARGARPPGKPGLRRRSGWPESAPAPTRLPGGSGGRRAHPGPRARQPPAFDREAGFAAATNGAPPPPSERHLLHRLRRLARRTARRLGSRGGQRRRRRLGPGTRLGPRRALDAGGAGAAHRRGAGL